MANIDLTIIKYTELNEGVNCIEGDDFGIAAEILSEPRVDAYLKNPNLSNDYKYGIALSRVDGKIVGRAATFPTRFKIDSEIYESISGTALEVKEEYRHFAVGADIVTQPIFDKQYNYIVYSGISDMALSLYRKLRFIIFPFPRLMLAGRSRSLLEFKGVKGAMLNILSPLVDIPINVLHRINRYRGSKIAAKYMIKKLEIVPEWVNEITLNDGHKYMEVHDQKWLQWNLDCNFRGLNNDIQSFYAIYNLDRPIAFFFLKERYRENAGGLKKVHIGSIMEWGISKGASITEADIIKIALTKFSKNLDVIEFATVDRDTIAKMKSFGFINHGDAHIAFKDLSKVCKDANDINLWRIRYGYADVILT